MPFFIFSLVVLMPSTANQNSNPSDPSPAESSSKSKFRKGVERFLMLSAVIGTIIVCMLYSELIAQYINPSFSKSTIYGRWVEQDVAHYVREEFVVSERGVMINGSTVATDFEFDGNSFSYKLGSTVRRFKFTGKQHAEMKLDADSYYLPVFRLEDSSI